jgi:hypothetical protein
MDPNTKHDLDLYTKEQRLEELAHLLLNCCIYDYDTGEKAIYYSLQKLTGRVK